MHSCPYKQEKFRKTIWIILFVTVSGNLFSQKLQDTLFFTNGSVILGEVKRIKLGVVNFDPEDANDITVQLIKLKTISATSGIFRIETTGQHVYYGRLIPNSKTGFITIVTAKDTLLLPIEKISVLYPFKDDFLDRFDGNISLGYNYTRSSNFGRVNFDLNLSYITRQDEITFAA